MAEEPPIVQTTTQN